MPIMKNIKHLLRKILLY